MKAAHKREEEERTSERHRAAATLDSGEARAVVLTASALTVFFYFIKVILLPFLLAAIVAYVCTPLLDWLGKHTRLPRWLFAVVLFLLILAVAALTISFAAQHLAVEGRSIASDLPDMVDKWCARRSATSRCSCSGSPSTRMGSRTLCRREFTIFSSRTTFWR
jgi:AI-2E family transporter